MDEQEIKIIADHWMRGRRICFDNINFIESILADTKNSDEKLELIKTAILETKHKLKIQQVIHEKIIADYRNQSEKI